MKNFLIFSIALLLVGCQATPQNKADISGDSRFVLEQHEGAHQLNNTLMNCDDRMIMVSRDYFASGNATSKLQDYQIVIYDEEDNSTQVFALQESSTNVFETQDSMRTFQLRPSQTIYTFEGQEFVCVEL